MENSSNGNKNYIREIKSESSYFVRNGEAIKIIEKYVKPPGFVLEIGPGKGELLELLRSRNYNVEAIDNKNRINRGNDQSIKMLNICFSPLPFAEGHFDGIVMFEVMEHLENPYFAIKEIHRTLKREGKLIFSMPNIFNIKSRLMFLFRGDVTNYTFKNDHRTIFTRSVFLKTFKEFIVLEKIYGGGFIKLFGRKIMFKSQIMHKIFGQRILYVLEKK